MKLTTLLLLVAFMQVSATGMAQTVTLSKKNISLEKVFKEIHKQTGYSFLCTKEQLASSEKIDVRLENAPLKEVLDSIFGEQPLGYRILNKTIIVRRKKQHESRSKEDDAEIQLLKKITGTVIDSTTGEPLVGVTIQVKGNTMGTTTNAKGEFSLEVSKDVVLQISYLGYETKEVFVDGKTTFEIALASAATGLNQLVVVGYGTEKKVNLTGAVDQVGSEVFEGKSTSNALRSLQGALSGTFLTFASGRPNDDLNPVVRGVGSIGAGGRALVLIDGVPGDISRLNPQDIKSVSVIKDASAAAIYGSRGAFGVILVTTKEPQKGKMHLNYSYNYSLKDRTVKPKLLTDGYLWAKDFNTAYYGRYKTYPTTVNTGLTFSQEYLKELKRKSENGELPSVGIDPSSGEYVYYGSTDWQKLLYADYNPSQEHNLSISGGSDKLDYYLSGRYYHQHGIYRYSPDKYKQYNLRAKGSIQVFPWLKVSNNFSFSKRTYYYPESHHVGGNIERRMYFESSPLSMLYNPDGSFTKNAALTLQSFITGHNYRKYNYGRFKNTVGLDAKFLNDNLKIHGDFSYIFTPYFRREQRTPVTYSDAPDSYIVYEPDNDFLKEIRHRSEYLGTNIYADYSRNFNNHHLKLMIGFNYENTFREDNTFQRNGLINPNLPNASLLTGQDITILGGGYEWTTAGEFFRLNYNYDNRYLLEFNGRYDGSSKFPFHQQYGFFPSVSAGWRVSQESFWKMSKKIVSNLKIRGSYGSLGNGNVSPYSFLETMPVSQLDIILQGKNPMETHDPNVIPNGLTWEKVTTLNVGIDMSLLDYRLDVSFDKFTRYTTGMFTRGMPLPGVFGAGVPKGNYADLKTNGWELSLNWHDQTKGSHPLKYQFKVSVSDNFSEVTAFNNPNGLINTYYKGQMLGDIWGFRTDGLFQSKGQILREAVDQSKVAATTNAKKEILPGDLKFVDLNGDGKIDRGANTLDDHGDLTIIGNSQPRYLFGFNGNFQWQGFDLAFFLQGVGKRDWWPGNEAGMFWGMFQRPYAYQPMDVHDNYWTPDNPYAYFPRLVGYEANNANQNKALNQPSDRYLQNAAYIRLKNLSIGYSLPKELISKIGMSEVRIYFSGLNLWVWSPIFQHTHAFDPESILSPTNKDSYIQSVTTRYETGLYPKLKTFTVGVNIKF